MIFFNEKYLKYLPTKKFALITSGIIALAIFIYAIFFMSGSGESFTVTGNKNTDLKVQNQTISELIEKDSDGDSVPDWEEALWGTDKDKKITFNDMPDATYIENKKKELNIEESVDENKLTETEKFAREFFTSYTAMKSSGVIDSNTINSFSNALGQKIVNPNLIDQYGETDVKISQSDDSAAKEKYYSQVKSYFKSYRNIGIGNEIDIVSRGLTKNSNDVKEINELTPIGNAYQDFAKKIMELSVPQSLVTYHLRIANSANNTGISVISLKKISSDPIVGLSGLSEYQKYSDSLVKAVSDLETFLGKQ